MQSFRTLYLRHSGVLTSCRPVPLSLYSCFDRKYMHIVIDSGKFYSSWFFFQFQNRATTLGYDLRCGSFYSPDLDNPALWWIHLSFALNLVLTYYYFSVHGRHLVPYSHVWTLSKRIPCLLHPVTLRELFLTFWQLLCWQSISFVLFCDLGRTPESIEDPWINGQDLNFSLTLTIVLWFFLHHLVQLLPSSLTGRRLRGDPVILIADRVRDKSEFKLIRWECCQVPQLPAPSWKLCCIHEG